MNVEVAGIFAVSDDGSVRPVKKRRYFRFRIRSLQNPSLRQAAGIKRFPVRQIGKRSGGNQIFKIVSGVCPVKRFLRLQRVQKPCSAFVLRVDPFEIIYLARRYIQRCDITVFGK